MRLRTALFFIGLSSSVAACTSADAAPPPLARAESSAAGTPASARARSAAAPTALPPVTAVYPWKPTATRRLDADFVAPDGFTRVTQKDGTFGAFLHTLPLLPDGALVVDYKGSPLYDGGHHDNIAAVVDLDVGKANLQHCADVVIRLHAEWQYGRGDREIAYKSNSNTSIPYKRYVAGEHAVVTEQGGIVFARRSGEVKDDHGLFRSYLDDVFTWANTRSLDRDAARVSFSDVRAGDFFLMTGSPFGHAVVVVDVAKDARGRTALLLGQGYMPAQGFYVLRESKREAWFIVEPGASEVKTPFWQAFPVEALRRL